MNDRIPHTESDLVLPGVKAEPLRGGLRPALTPAPGELLTQPAGDPSNNRNNKTQVSTVSGDCHRPSSMRSSSFSIQRSMRSLILSVGPELGQMP